MRRQIRGVPARDINRVNVGIGKAHFQTVSVKCPSVGAPGHRLPEVVRSIFVSEQRHLARRPIHQRNVVNRRFLGLVVQGDGLAVGRPARVLFTNFGSVGQIDGFTALARNGEDVPEFVAARILLKQDPLAIRRPSRAVLSVIRLRQLNRPSPVCVHLPQI